MSPESSQNGTLTPSASPQWLTNKQSANKQKIDTPEAGEIRESIEKKFGDFLDTLGNTLMDFTALEVNTMIVSGITGAKFNAFDAYCVIYKRHQEVQQLQKAKEHPGQNAAVEHQLPEKLWPRYEKLYHQLLTAYHLCPGINQSEELPDPDNPEGFKILAEQLKEVPFVRTIRKLSELRAALDGQNTDSPKEVDLIYAQTVMQIDGDVINRYNQALFDPENITRREIILSIHNQGVEAGERQWRGLMQFMVDLLKNFVDRSFLDKK
ncbi:MAG: hypothetical protein ACO3EZ_16050 [Prochlorotrichaceae cyanobacterium]